MKYCSKCGAQSEDTVKFCISCGSKFEVKDKEDFQVQEPQTSQQPELQPQQPPQQQQYQPPQQQQFQPPPQPPLQTQPPLPPPQQPAQYIPPYSYQPPRTSGRQLSSNPAVNILKQAGSSPLFGTVVVMYSINLLLQIIQIIMNAASNPLRQVISTLYDLGIYREIPGNIRQTIDNFVFRANVATIIFSLIMLIIPILIGVGMWMHFTASGNKSNDGLKLGGLTLIKICTIINFVFVCIAMLAGVGIGVIALIASISSGYGVAIAVAIGVIIGVAIAVFFALFYYIKLFKSIKAVKMCVITGTPNYKMSVFVAVMHFIAAFVGIIGLISIAATLFYAITIWAILSFLVSLISILVSILISIAMLSYNSKIQRLYYSQNPPVQYQQPPVYNPNNQYPNRY